MIKAKAVTAEDIALHLSGVTRRKMTNINQNSKPHLHAHEMLDNFGVSKIWQALAKKKVDITWYINKLISMAENAERDADALNALEKIKEMMIIGAIQDPELAEWIQARSTGKPPKSGEDFDPFTVKVKKTLKLKKA